MGILSRFKDIMTANINALLEKAEAKNADKILENYLREAKANLEEVKAETAGVIADEMAAARKVDACQDEIDKLQKYAEQAVLAGNDGDAKKFLEAKNSMLEKKADAEKVYEQARANSNRMREMTKKLTGDIQEADAKLQELISKLSVAEQTEKMNELSQKIGTTTYSFTAYEELADAVQKRIDAADAKAQLNQELNSEYDMDALKAKYNVSEQPSAATVDDELSALKARLGK
ncbi:MAG: PspA/IM30 family protein [Oscillospiraceae bacterium]|nr:PspA/IM30 family protein [Oscillospiraceae bacterium]